MKLINYLFLAVAALALAWGCSSKKTLDEWMRPGGNLKILSTTAQIGDLVSEIGGERVSGRVLIQGDLDPHSYELVKGDGEKFDRADLVFYNGLGLEHGASLSARLTSDTKALALGELAPRDKILKRGEAADPHIWMDISLWAETVRPIVQRLSEKDPEGASYYEQRGEALLHRMGQAHEKIRSLLLSVPSEKRYLVTSHDAFHYFTRSYLADPGDPDWRSRFAAPEGLAPDGQLNPNDIRKIIDFLREKNISVLFPESNVSRDSIRKIASAGREFGLTIRICQEALYGDSMSGLSYFEMMDKNAETIARHLGHEE